MNYAQWAQAGVHISTLCFVLMMMRFMKRMNDERLKQEQHRTMKVLEALDSELFDKRILKAADDWFDDKPNSKVLLRQAIDAKRRNQGMSDPTDTTVSK